MWAHDLDTAEAGYVLARIALIAGVSGTLFGGVVADRLAARDRRWYVWTPILSAYPGWGYSGTAVVHSSLPG